MNAQAFPALLLTTVVVVVLAVPVDMDEKGTTPDGVECVVGVILFSIKSTGVDSTVETFTLVIVVPTLTSDLPLSTFVVEGVVTPTNVKSFLLFVLSLEVVTALVVDKGDNGDNGDASDDSDAADNVDGATSLQSFF